jgi:regulator of sigma E protease
MLLGSLAGLLAISLLVLVHEGGHLVAARLAGLPVSTFSVGIGPWWIARTFGDTEVRLSAIPFGGYIKLGRPENDDVDPLAEYPASKRMWVHVAGPAANLFLTVAIFACIAVAGEPDLRSQMGMVLPGSPAAIAGLQTGDHVRVVNGEPVVYWRELEQRLNEAGRIAQPVDLTVERAGTEIRLTLPAIPIGTDRAADTFRLGIAPSWMLPRVGPDGPDAPAARAGLSAGDLIIEVDGRAVGTWDELLGALSGSSHTLVVKALDGTPRTIVIDQARTGTEAMLPYANRWGLVPATLLVGGVRPGSPAEAAGVQPGDRMWKVADNEVWAFQHLGELVEFEAARTRDHRVPVTLLRGGAPRTVVIEVAARVGRGEARQRLMAGLISHEGLYRYVDLGRRRFSPAAALGVALDQTISAVSDTGALLANIFTGAAEAQDRVGGPVAIVHTTGAAVERGPFVLARLIAMLSVSLGLVNLLPVPLLDGGQILFSGIELVRGRRVSPVFREKVQIMGLLALVVLILLVTANDLQRWLSA